MSSTGKRIRSLREERDWTQKELAARAMVERATVASWETDRRTPEPSALNKLADLFGVSIDYLLGRLQAEEIRITRQHPTLPFIRFPEGARAVIKISQKTLPILGRIKAGVPLLSEQHIVGEIEVPETIGGHADFALEVTGNSMIGAGLQPGDYVFMRTTNRRMPAHGDIVAAMVDGDMTLKRYVKRGGQFWLHAENPQYPDIIVDRTVIIQGVYVGRFSEFQGNVEPPVEDMTEDELITKLAQLRGLDPDQVAGMLDVLSRKRR